MRLRCAGSCFTGMAGAVAAVVELVVGEVVLVAGAVIVAFAGAAKSTVVLLLGATSVLVTDSSGLGTAAGLVSDAIAAAIDSFAYVDFVVAVSVVEELVAELSEGEVRLETVELLASASRVELIATVAFAGSAWLEEEFVATVWLAGGRLSFL